MLIHVLQIASQRNFEEEENLILEPPTNAQEPGKISRKSKFTPMERIVSEVLRALYAYISGGSYKNSLYCAKYLEFFESRLLQKVL